MRNVSRPTKFLLALFTIIGAATLFGPASAVAKPSKSTVSPGPTARNASMFSEISFRGLPVSKAGKISVRGSRSGFHRFSRRRHSDNQGFSLVMKHPFRAAERVKVRTALTIPGAKRGDYGFKVENLGGPRVKRSGNNPLNDPGPAQFISRPDLRPAKLNIRRNLPGADREPLFIGAKSLGAAIYAADGEPIWFRSGRTTDFRAQELRGKPVLTWFEGPTAGSGLDRNRYTIANRAYKVINRFSPGNGYSADSHEFRLTDRGTAYVTTYRTVRRNLSYLGLSRNGRVSDSIAQEVDVKTGRVLWEWHSLDHVPMRQSYATGPKRPELPYDYFHINSIIDTPDGNVMISGRSTNTVYKVSKRTGRVIWNLGGKRSDYKIGPGATFSWQHDAQPLSGNRVSLFDNSDSPVAAKPWNPYSRGMVLQLDNRKKTATLEYELLHPDRPLAPTQANVQALSNGNYLVGWGQVPLISEYGPNGNMVFDARIGTDSFYRAYRMPWQGRPSEPIATAIEAGGPGSVNLWVSWNGDSRVRKWRVLAGSNRNDLKPIDTLPKAGFETRIELANDSRFFKIEGLDEEGRVLGRSALVQAP